MRGTGNTAAAGPTERPPVALSKTSQEVVSAEGQLDTSLMRSAARIEQEMQAMGDSSEASQKKAALTSQSQETQRDRAARYFETHGLSKMNSMLGLHAATESAAPPKTSPEAVHEDAEAVHEDAEEEDEDYHKRWAAADALRLRRPAAVA